MQWYTEFDSVVLPLLSESSILCFMFCCECYLQLIQVGYEVIAESKETGNIPNLSECIMSNYKCSINALTSLHPLEKLSR